MFKRICSSASKPLTTSGETSLPPLLRPDRVKQAKTKTPNNQTVRNSLIVTTWGAPPVRIQLNTKEATSGLSPQGPGGVPGRLAGAAGWEGGVVPRSFQNLQEEAGAQGRRLAFPKGLNVTFTGLQYQPQNKTPHQTGGCWSSSSLLSSLLLICNQGGRVKVKANAVDTESLHLQTE